MLFRSPSVTKSFDLLWKGLEVTEQEPAAIQDLFAGQPVFRADSEHIHHRLLEMGHTQRRAVAMRVHCDKAESLAVGPMLELRRDEEPGGADPDAEGVDS